MLGLGTGIVKSNLYESQYLAAVFDGTDDFITVPDNDALSFTTSTGFGISMWLNLTPDPGVILYHGILVKGQEYKFHVTASGSAVFVCVDDSNKTKTRRVTNTDTFPFSEWVHVVAEYRTNEVATIHINGIAVSGTNTIDSDFEDMENIDADLIIGVSTASISGETSDGPARFTNGAITNLNIYQGNLSSTERNNVYNAAPSGNFNGLVDNTIIASYLLTSDLNDSSGNGHNGSSASGQSPTFIIV